MNIKNMPINVAIVGVLSLCAFNSVTQRRLVTLHRIIRAIVQQMWMRDSKLISQQLAVLLTHFALERISGYKLAHPSNFSVFSLPLIDQQCTCNHIATIDNLWYPQPETYFATFKCWQRNVEYRRDWKNTVLLDMRICDESNPKSCWCLYVQSTLLWL